VCWVVAYLAVFSAAATKLPNYVYPIYPALAILTARVLVGWRDGSPAVPGWVPRGGAVALAVVGAATCGGLVYADRMFPGLAAWAVVGLVPVAGAAGMFWCLKRNDRGGVVAAAAAAAVVFSGLVAAFPPSVMEAYKAPRELVRASGVGQPGRELRLASLQWFQPTTVFYAGRRVERLPSADAAAEFLATPTPAYLFVPAPVWEKLAPAMPGTARVVARHVDFMKRCDILVVTNTPPGDVAAR
jgi:4-amino-4-deoxy-L-arabinose transferase-like glycosyltransferase